MVRLGLCCQFYRASIKFRTATAAGLKHLSRDEALNKLADICLHNAEALREALGFCAEHSIGAFRVSSPILPLKTHPEAGYDVEELPGADRIKKLFKACGSFARRQGIRLSFHPDQFIVLNSPREEVVQSAVEELVYQAEVSEWIGGDVINIHAGGVYGDKKAALSRFKKNYRSLPAKVKRRLTLENDDKNFTPEDLLPLCRQMKIPLVYDVHHHRCNPDRLGVKEATDQAIATWNREPLFHVSSPKEGWKGKMPQRHHDYIHLRDFPSYWMDLDITVDVEAKAKELAVLRLQRALARRIEAGRREVSRAS
ncbi:MAG: UV DNA damage repair endonuclease UvsE [Planctomycetota bacterium]|jgi:UV DNA damage endonuclease